MVADCGSYCPVSGGFYKYKPSIGGNVALLVGFLLLVPWVIFLGLRSRTPFLTLSLLSGLVFYVLGFIGRILLHHNLDSPGLFLLSLLGTILGPSLIVAATFIILPHVLAVYGEHFSPFRPTVAELILCTLITIATGIEVVGSVFVAYAFNGVTRAHSASIIAAGLGVQAVALLGGAAIYFSFTLGLISGRDMPDNEHSAVYEQPRFGRFLRGLEISTTLLLAYSIYRLVEITGGIEGGLFQNEAAFMVMNGAIPLVSCILLTVFYPGTAFGRAWQATSVRRKQEFASPLPRHEEFMMSYSPHHAYNPNIRKQQASFGHYVESQSGSPGLPSNPRPSQQSRSPKVSPRSATTSKKRFSGRSERVFSPRQDMVDSDALW